MTQIDSLDLRQALSQFATGVTIVTTAGHGAKPVGITANSFNSVSLDPPIVLWSLCESAGSRSAFEAAEHFCVHVLTSEQEALSERFACAGANKFADLEWSRGIGQVPLLGEFVARFQCRTAQRFPIGDHIVFVGEVLEFAKTGKRPLVFHSGEYAMAERRRQPRNTPRIRERRKTAGN